LRPLLERKVVMIEQALRSFCEARHRSLIVIAGTFMVGLLLVLPLVDVIRAGHDEKEALITELDSAKTVASGLERFESRVNDKIAEMQLLEARTVDDETMPALREKLVDLAKETACSVRRISVGNTATRRWTPGDNPVGQAEARQDDPSAAFRLEWRPVSISLTGTSANLRAMLERISESNMLVHAKAFDMYPSSANRQTLTLELELWYFTLAGRS